MMESGPRKSIETMEQPSTLIVKAENIGVRFSIFGPRQSTKGRLVRLFKPKIYFWALRNVSFTVQHGERFFIIGRNGAGKTTLLKVLAETLLPNEGCLSLWGDVSAFLSMGLGFQDDLSGRDNIAIALQLIGVSRKEIPSFQKDIIDFTRLDMFMDTPVRNYSAGMRARLAFAIATSIEPEILIMDEVMSAGDEEFRTKSQKRIHALLNKAKAIVVCTHDLARVREMANRVMWIEQGHVQAIGSPEVVVSEYLSFIQRVQEDPFYDFRSGSREDDPREPFGDE